MITTCSRDAMRRAFARRLEIHHRLLTARRIASTNEPAYQGLSLALVCPTFTCCGRTRLLSDVTAFRYLHQRLLSSSMRPFPFDVFEPDRMVESPLTLTTTGYHANQRRYSDRLCSRNVSMCCRVTHRMQVDLFFGPRITKYIQYLADSNEKD